MATNNMEMEVEEETDEEAKAKEARLARQQAEQWKMLQKMSDFCEELIRRDYEIRDKLRDRILACNCGDVDLFSLNFELPGNDQVFNTSDGEMALFVAICGKLKSIKEVENFIWCEIADQTGAVWCRIEKNDTVDDTFKIFGEKFKKIARNENKDEIEWEEMQVVRNMKLGSFRAKDKYTAIQRQDFRWCDDKFPHVIVRGKLAKKKKNMYIFVNKVWMAKTEEVMAFNQMLKVVKSHKNIDLSSNNPFSFKYTSTYTRQIERSS